MEQAEVRRPFWVGRVPERLEGFLYYNFLGPVPRRYDPLFASASLRFAAGVRMTVPRSRDFMYEGIALLGYYERHLSRRVRASLEAAA